MADEEAAAEEADSATWTKGPTVDFARELEGQTEEAGSFRARGRRVFLTLAGLEPTYATLWTPYGHSDLCRTSTAKRL